MSSEARPPEEIRPRRAVVIHAFKWSILGEAASRLIAPAIFLILARLLTPEDFGVVAAATVLTSLCQALADAGLAKALVQHREELDLGAQAVFWMSLLASLLLACLLVVAAPWIAWFFGDPRIEAVVRWLSLQVPLAGLCAVPTALLQRDFRFRRLFWVRLVAAGLPALASIPLALSGFGYWAIVAGLLAGQALQCVSLWLQCDWRPRWQVDAAVAARLLRFGRWTAVSALLAWGYGWLDVLVVARYLGSHDMGIYRIGSTFVTMVFGLCFTPLLPVLYSDFSRMGHERERVAGQVMEASRTIVAVSVPIGAAIALLSPEIEALLFGPAWSGLAPVIALLAAAHGLAWLVGVNGEGYRAVGRPDLESWAMGISIVLYSIGYLVAIRYGLVAFAAMRVALVSLGIAVQCAISGRIFGLRVSAWLAASTRPVVFAAVAYVAAWLASNPRQGIGSALIATLVFASVYLSLLAAFDRDRFAFLRRHANGT